MPNDRKNVPFSETVFAWSSEGKLEWYQPSGVPDLDVAEAQVVATAMVARALDDISGALMQIADAIQSKD